MQDIVPLRPSVSFEVERIIGMSVGNGNVRNYHVQWAPTWVSGMNLVGCEHLIQHFLLKQEEVVKHKQGEVINTQGEDTNTQNRQLYNQHQCLQQELKERCNGEERKKQDLLQHQQQEQEHHQTEEQLELKHQEKQQHQLHDKESVATLSKNGQCKTNTSLECSNDGGDATDGEMNLVDAVDLESLTGGLMIQSDAPMQTSREEDLGENHETSAAPVKNGFCNENFQETPCCYEIQGIQVMAMKGDDLHCEMSSTDACLDDKPNPNFEWIKVEEEKEDSCENMNSSSSECDSKNLTEGLYSEGGSESSLSSTSHTESLVKQCPQNIMPVRRGATFVVEQPGKGSVYVKRCSKESNTCQEINHRQSGKKVYECVECKKTFSNRGNLNTHLRLHTGEKPYRCSECDKSFSRKHHLNDHYSRFHTGELVYRCAECNVAFTRKHHLTEHKRTHRKGEMTSMVQL